MDFNLLPIHLSAEAATSVLALLLLLYCLVWRKINAKSNARKLPQPSGAWPFIGHLPLLGKLPHINLGRLADKYGPIFMIKLGVNRALVVSTGEMAKECLGTNDKAFATRPYTTAVKLMGYNSAMLPLSPYGPYWREMRKIITVELLSNHRIDMLKDFRISEVKSAIKRISAAGSIQKIDMKQWFDDLSIDTVARLIAGKSLKELNQGQCAMVFRDFFELAGAFVPADALPLLKCLDIGGYQKKMKKVAKEIDDMAHKWLEEHKLTRKSAEEQKNQDFMDVMLGIFETGQQNTHGFDADTIIKAMSLAMILAGADTTAVTLTWALSLLLNNKDVLKKTQAELDIVVGNKRQVEESDLKNLVYLQAVLKETMRLYPAGPLSIPREAITDCTVSGYHIPAGTQLFVNLYKIHRDPKVWEDPLEFHPERFLKTYKDYDFRGPSYELMPFGNGRRKCPGISFALQSMEFTLASLLHEFDISTPSNETVDMSERFGLTNIKATPLEVILTHRLPQNRHNNPTLIVS